MNVAVRYFTRSGNTEKLAQAVAEAVCAEAKSIASPLEEKADILFRSIRWTAVPKKLCVWQKRPVSL